MTAEQTSCRLARNIRHLAWFAKLSVSFGVVILLGTQAQSVTLGQHFASCKTSTATVPDKVGNFGSVHEGLQHLNGESKEFLTLLSTGLKTFAANQREYAKSLHQCLEDKKKCSPEAEMALARDKQAIQDEWSKMRMGLALGFPGFLCNTRCIGYEPKISHLFQWAKPFAKPEQMGLTAINAEWNVEGALSVEESEQAKELLAKITDPILNRELTIWDYLAQAFNPISVQGVNDLNVQRAAGMLARVGPNGEPSFRDRWKQNYFEAIKSAPLLLFVSQPNPSQQELAQAYKQIEANANELIKGLLSQQKMKAWDYFRLTARDILMTYHGVIESILQEPAHQKYCGVAERMLTEKISNDSTKFAVQLGGTLVTGVGCIMTGSSYVGLSLCAISSMGFTAKATADARAQADQARIKAGSSATPTLLVDDYQSLSNVDQEAVTAEVLKYFALVDVAALGTVATKMTIKGYTFLKRMEQFSREVAQHQNASPQAVRLALREVLKGSPALTHVQKASELLSFLPKGVLTEKNSSEVGRIAKSLSPMIAQSEISHWARVISVSAEGGVDGATGLALLTERAQQNFVLGYPQAQSAFARALEKEVARIQVDKNELASVAVKNQWQQTLRKCLEEPSSSCAEDFARIGRTAFRTDADQISREAIARAGQSTLQRSLNDDEIQAIFEARRLGSLEGYTPEEVIQQNKLLKKAGLQQNEIDQLRRHRVIGNWVRETVSSTPTGVQTIHSSIALERGLVEKIKAGHSVTYLIDDLDQLRVTETSVDLTGNSILMARVVDAQGALHAVRVREAGEITFDSVSRKIEFRAKYGHSAEGPHPATLNPETRDAIIRANPALQKSKVISCLDILQARQSGKGFVMNNIMADNLVLTGALISSEAMGAGRMKDKEGREVIYTDYVASNVSSTINSFIRKNLTLKNANFASYATSRLSTNFALIEMQREIFRANLTQNGDERATLIRDFNLGWTVARLPTNYYFDRYLMNTLPLQLYSTCSQGSKSLQIILHPRMVAIYEKTFFSILYFQSRQLIVNE